jgi:hypothetical protein
VRTAVPPLNAYLLPPTYFSTTLQFSSTHHPPGRSHPPELGGSEIITRLEMTSPDQLVPGTPPPTPIDLIVAGPESAPAVRSTYVRIWAPLKAHGRMEWSDDEWRAELSHPDARS